MANFSLYISGQTELGDVTEFFQKRLIGEGETPIAFFDGVFYESHQERVGNIVYQDYLIFSDKALYLWARGASKDYLDRFSLGAVSVNSRNKDSAFATMNLKIRREGKEPVFVIFDMVEIREASMIIKLQTAVESTIEECLGIDYRHEIPPDAADRILQAARAVCPPRTLSLPLESPQSPQMPVADAGIGYGQDLLEQYRAMGGAQAAPQQAPPYGERPQAGGMGMPPGMGAPPFAPRGGLESMLPTDPASLKRIADQIKSMVGNAPFKLRDQVMKDLQHVPGDVATVLTALNELLANIAGNPMAERFVMNAIKTAVVNDGMIGSLGKIIKMTGFGGGGGKKSSQSSSAPPSAAEERAGSRPRKSPFEEEDADDSSTIRRRKISVKDDEESSAADLFAGSDEPITSRAERKPAAPPKDEPGAGGGRKKLSIKMEDDNEIARKLMSYDESEREGPVCSAPATSPAAPSVDGGMAGVRRKKVSIKAEVGSGAGADVAQKLMTYDEATRGAINTLSKSVAPEAEDAPEIVFESEPAPETPVRKKIQIVAAEEPEAEAGLDVAPEAASETELEPERAAPVRRSVHLVATEEEPKASTEADSEPVAIISPELKPEAVADASASEPFVTEAVSTSALEPEPEPESREPSVADQEPLIELEASDEFVISEEALFVALGQEPEPEERSSASNEYMTIESDDPERKSVSEKPTEQQRRPAGKAGRNKRRGKKV